MNKEYDNIAEGDHRKFIDEVMLGGGPAAVERLIQENMRSILKHYIECTWGPCYNTKFKELIQPHLKDAEILADVLKSPIIKDKNAVTGKTGARIYRELFFELLRCDSQAIRSYLLLEFEGIRFS